MSENEKDFCGDEAYCRVCGEGCGPDAQFCADEPEPVVLGDGELRILQDVDLPEETPNEDIASLGDRAFFDRTLMPCGFGDQRAAGPQFASRLMIRLPLVGSRSGNFSVKWEFGSGAFSASPASDRPSERLFSGEGASRTGTDCDGTASSPPLDESRLTITAWQRRRLLGCLKIKRFLKKCFHWFSIGWVGRPRYATGRETARLSRPSRPVG